MFSIITVTYNCASSIEKTIASVLEQEEVDYEYIIIDGKSTDGTAETIEKYRGYLSFYISEPDKGIYDAMNKAIDRANGDYLFFLNGDDTFCSKDALSRIEKYLNGKEIIIGQVYYGSRLSKRPCSDIKSPYYGIFYPHQGMFIPKRLFASIGKYDTSYKISADFEWICRAICRGERIKWVDVPVSNYRIGGRSDSVQCVIDEYNISKKYLLLSNQNDLVIDMKKQTIERVKDAILREIMKNKKYHELLRPIVLGFFPCHKSVSLWGAGYLSKLYIDAFEKCGITIEQIIDKNPISDEIMGIPVCKYDKEKIKNLFISTEVYDEEISVFLRNEGLCEPEDFISHRALRDQLIYQMNKNDDIFMAIDKECDIDISADVI